MNEDIRKKAADALHLFIGNDKDFRDGQYEAIEATLTNKRTLVVQRTGWGKSMVYFICTKILRDEGRGATLIVSPLLSLMDNQIQAAENSIFHCDCKREKAVLLAHLNLFAYHFIVKQIIR